MSNRRARSAFHGEARSGLPAWFSLPRAGGSGKAVANLAIRIGLGQVLTNKVFSVLMGDEVDASMDDDRAGYTAECLERLTNSIGQVVLVSHKQTDAEHHIHLS